MKMVKSSYSFSFWDPEFTGSLGFDTLVKRMNDGKTTCKLLEQFLKTRAKCEDEYSKGLIKLSKGMVELTESGSINEAWLEMKKETENVAKIHMEAVRVLNETAQSLSEFQKKLRFDRKFKEEKVSNIFKEKVSYFKKTMEAKRNYEARSVEAKMAEDSLKKAREIESSFQTKEFDKIVSKSTKAVQECSKAEIIYKDLVTKLDEIRINWENEHTNFCELCEAQDEKRILSLLNFMWEATNITSVTCLETDKLMEKVREALEEVDARNDNAFFVECFRTGIEKPEAIEFETYVDSPQNNRKTLPKPMLTRLLDKL